MRPIFSTLSFATLVLTCFSTSSMADIVRPGGWIEVGYVNFVAPSTESSVNLRAIQASQLAVEAPSDCAPVLIAFQADVQFTGPFGGTGVANLRFERTLDGGDVVDSIYTFADERGARLVVGANLSLVSDDDWSTGTCPITILGRP